MGKILLGVVTAAAWFVLSQAAHAEHLCQQVCDGGTCVSQCIDNPDSTGNPDTTVTIYDPHAPALNVGTPGTNSGTH
jgi:hypothetical protein